MIPEYFVITDFREFRRHHNDMQQYLVSRGTLVAESDSYQVYRLATE
jgi:hypothetical protein